MTYKECYEYGNATLVKAGIEEAAWDARLLLEHVCNTNRNDLLVHGDRVVDLEQTGRYRQFIAKRAERVPLQHLTGVQEFMGLEFNVNEQVLIPRQDTEILVEAVLKELHDGMHILDMCTGSGCILISLLHYSNKCKGVGVDISTKALAVAEKNAQKLLGRCKKEKQSLIKPDEVMQQDMDASHSMEENAQITFVHSNLFENVTGKYDIIVSNPPYIRSQVIPTLMPEVKDHEPLQALDGTEDGLFFYRQITEESRRYLMKGGMLFFEIGHDQAEDVSSLMEEAGFHNVKVIKDLAGLDRVVYGDYCKI
ncbi:MAG: peptide chain release factor N(5)-glutamine methyltransferase [Lachnospiraceae bacterium]|nr:peptide chain release factor N(5)-glutamine methyltransferase [Lachnospiraceae bacterium]